MTWATVGISMAVGAGVGAGSGILQGEDSDTVLKKALIGGATGAITGGIGAGAESTVAPELLGEAGMQAAGSQVLEQGAESAVPQLLNQAGQEAVPQIAPEIISGAAQIGPPPAAGIEQIAPTAPLPTAGAPTGINQFSPAELNAVNLGYADSLAAQGTGTQVAGPAMNVAPTSPPAAGINTVPAAPPPSTSMTEADLAQMTFAETGRYPTQPLVSEPPGAMPDMSTGPSSLVSEPRPNPFMEGFASVKDFVKKNPLESAVIGYAGLTALNSFGSKEDPRKKRTYTNKYPISPNFQPSRPEPNVYQSRYAEGGITSFDDEAGVDQFAPGGAVRKERDADADFKRYYSMMNARPEAAADEEALRKPRFARDDDSDTRYQDALTAALIRQKKNNARANIGTPSVQRPTPLGTLNLAPPGAQQAASGGIMGSSLGGYAAGGNPRLLKGPGDGMSDNIPAVIGNKQPARLADGEFVVPADVVSHLGNGSTDAGAKKLHQMMDRIRTDRTGKKRQAPAVNADKYLPGKKKASGGMTEYASGGIAGYAEGGTALRAADDPSNPRNQTVAGLYDSVLGRKPDAAGLAYYSNLLATGTPIEQIRASMAASPEARTNQVQQIFNEQLGRNAEQTALDFYTNALASGQSLADVTAGINRTVEGINFDTQTIESAYNRNMRRTAEQEGFQFWLSQAQATPKTQKQLTDAIIAAANAKEKRDLGTIGKTYTDLEVSDFVADAFGGRKATKSIYDIPTNEADRINISYISGIPVQFVSPVTERALISKYGEGVFKASMGEDTYSPDRIAATADRAFEAGSMTKTEYDKVMTGLNGINQDIKAGKLDATKAGDSIRQLLNVPKGFKIIDPKYGQQIGEDNSMDIALAEAAKRQEILGKQDPGYYQANDILGQAYLNAGLTFPFMPKNYTENTMMTQADKLTPQNVTSKLDTTFGLLGRTGPYQTAYAPISPGTTNLPDSVRDPYSDEGLKVLYGRMMDQYGTQPTGIVNPATIAPTPYTYKPPVPQRLLDEQKARADYDAKVAKDRLAYPTSPITQSNFDATAYLRDNPDVARAGVDPFSHYQQHGINEPFRTITRLPFNPAPFQPTPLIAAAPAPAPVVEAAAPVSNKAGGLLSIKHRRRA